MDLKILVGNDIPSDGTIKITFTNVNIANSFLSTNTSLRNPVLTEPSPVAYYIYASALIYFNLLYIPSSAITGLGTILTLPIATKIPANTALTFTNLVTFSTGHPSVSVTTLDASATPNIIGTVVGTY
jgi:hypothetical protein